MLSQVLCLRDRARARKKSSVSCVFSSCKILLCEFEITADICVYYASTIFTFADCLGNESGSNVDWMLLNVVSLSDHAFHGLMLTTREHVNLAIRMLTESRQFGLAAFPFL